MPIASPLRPVLASEAMGCSPWSSRWARSRGKMGLGNLPAVEAAPASLVMPFMFTCGIGSHLPPSEALVMARPIAEPPVLTLFVILFHYLPTKLLVFCSTRLFASILHTPRSPTSTALLIFFFKRVHQAPIPSAHCLVIYPPSLSPISHYPDCYSPNAIFRALPLHLVSFLRFVRRPPQQT